MSPESTVNKGKAPFMQWRFFFGTQFEFSQLKQQHENPLQSRISFSGSYNCTERTSLCRIFMKMEKTGYYSVTISDQTQINSSNHFRFFDLSAGNLSFTVTNIMNGSQVFSGNVLLTNNKRMVVYFDQAWKMWKVDEVTISWTNWYTPGNTIVNGTTTTTTTTTTNNNTNGIVDFPKAKASIDAEMMDHGKLSKAKSTISKTSFTSAQIAEICKLFSFDNYKLDWAKYAYDYCSDKANYFLVSNTFTFSSYARDLEEYIKNK
jgi:hypothetical protein